jgi:hypothetical protein
MSYVSAHANRGETHRGLEAAAGQGAETCNGGLTVVVDSSDLHSSFSE